MKPRDFIEKWQAAELKERSASQEHFLDLCHLLDEPTPADIDPTGEVYAFEKGALKTGGGDGWADVWKKGCFAWEYKGKRKDLDKAYTQLQQYSVALENPPLLIVSDMERFRIHTNWTNTVQKVHNFTLPDLEDAATRDLLKSAFSDPEKLKPAKTRAMLTEEAATKFADLALRLRKRGHDPQAVAHFVNRLVFCMFAEDVGLLPKSLFTRMLEQSRETPEDFADYAKTLFSAMKTGGKVGFENVEWFNGGLFDDDAVLPLVRQDVREVLSAAQLDWSDIDPSLLGTLFERGLDPDKRSQLGAHYTDRDKIMLIVEPVIIEPLNREWSETKAKIGSAMRKAATAPTASARTKARKDAQAAHVAFIERLKHFRVLDPACGSGNFLYLSLLALKDIEHRANLEAEALGLARGFPTVGPENVFGIEINPYAAELARVSVWIGEIQWMRRNGFDAARNPVLRSLNNIECRDAILTIDDLTGEVRPAEWPAADVVVGNPPFLGGKLLRSLLGDEYVGRLFEVYFGPVPAEADLVCYWFARAWQQMMEERLKRAGFVATNSIRGGANRRLLIPIVTNGFIFDAWADQPWVVDGAAVRVSLVSFAKSMQGTQVHLDGKLAARVNADLTASIVDLTAAVRLPENAGVAFMGDTKGGAFDISGAQAREWLVLPSNPNGRTNADVLRPWINGMDLTRRPADKWIVDFGWAMNETSAALYEIPFNYIRAAVKPERDKNRRDLYRLNWWRHVEVRPGMWRALDGLKKYIATTRVAKYRLFVFCSMMVVPDSAIIVIARDDDTTFGILHSRFHELWSLRMCTYLGVGNDPRYTPSTTFETFPFPEGLTLYSQYTYNLHSTAQHSTAQHSTAQQLHALAIANAAKNLDALREAWLNPPDLVIRVPEVVAGYPDRILPKDEASAKILAKRTLTNLYNARPAWLDHAHRALDEAVAAAYGWPVDISDDDILARLFALNQARAAKQ